MVNKWGLQISIGGDSNINKQWDVYLALKSTFMMRGYGGSGKMRMLQQEQSGSIIRADFRILAFYCVQYSRTMSYLKNKIPFSLLKPPKQHVAQGRSSIFNALNLKNLEMKIQLCLFLKFSCALFCHNVRMCLFSRTISDYTLPNSCKS